MNYLKDVSGLSEEEGILLLSDYEVAVEYVESDKEKSTILYSKPQPGELVYENQMITLYVSKGYYLDRYMNLENLIYDDMKDYLEELINDYHVEVVITYKKDNHLLDGLIYNQITKDEFIEEKDVLELVVISNPKTVKIPDFTGWHYKDLLKYSKDNNINFTFEYVMILYPANCAVGQSVEAGSMVLKNSNPITIYLAKEN
jgi:beta-lactam-binding protein with PASTA domain